MTAQKKKERGMLRTRQTQALIGLMKESLFHSGFGPVFMDTRKSFSGLLLGYLS